MCISYQVIGFVHVYHVSTVMSATEIARIFVEFQAHGGGYHVQYNVHCHMW